MSQRWRRVQHSETAQKVKNRRANRTKTFLILCLGILVMIGFVWSSEQLSGSGGRAIATKRKENHAIAVSASLGSLPVSSSILGAYVTGANPAGEKAFGEEIGQQPSYAMDFLAGTSWTTISHPSYFTGLWKGTIYKMIWGVPMLPASGSSLANEATGQYNSYFVSTADTLVSNGFGNSIIRIGWEFNGGWFSWAANGHATTFIGAYRQVVDAFRSVPGQSFTFEWNFSLGTLGVGNLATYYPGNSYVTYIGADVYDNAWATYPGASANFANFETMPYGLNWLATFAKSEDKPIVFPEWGLGWGRSAPTSGPVSDHTPGTDETCGGDDPTFINDMVSWVAAHPVAEITFWDYGSSSIAGGNNPKTAAALAEDFSSTGTAPTGTPSTGTAPTGTPPTGTAPTGTPPTETLPPVDTHPTSATGYRMVAGDGGVFDFGNAKFHGSMGGKPLNKPVVASAATPTGNGYWEVASDGGIFSFGDAQFHGSMGGKPLNKPVVGMAADPATGGYWEVASDGGIFSFDAPFYGSMGGKPLNQPIVGMAVTSTGGGYWLVAADGGIFSFGDAQFHGSMGGKPLNQPIVGMAADVSTGGYWEVATTGGIFSFDAPFHGSATGHADSTVVGMAPASTGNGYWIGDATGQVFAEGVSTDGTMTGYPLNQPMVGIGTAATTTSHSVQEKGDQTFAVLKGHLPSRITGARPLSARFSPFRERSFSEQ